MQHRNTTTVSNQQQESEVNEMNLNSIEELVAELESSKIEFVSPYRASKIVNDLLGTRLPPQMFYNYVSKGYIASKIVKDHRVISRSELVRWFTAYSLKNHLDTL